MHHVSKNGAKGRGRIKHGHGSKKRSRSKKVGCPGIEELPSGEPRTRKIELLSQEQMLRSMLEQSEFVVQFADAKVGAAARGLLHCAVAAPQRRGAA